MMLDKDITLFEFKANNQELTPFSRIWPCFTSHLKGLKAPVYEVSLSLDNLFQNSTLLIDKTHPAF